MPEIYVSPSDLRQVSEQLNSCAKKIGISLQVIDNEILSLKGDKFLGNRASSLQVRYAPKRQALLIAKEIVINFANNLQQTASIFEQADRPDESTGMTGGGDIYATYEMGMEMTYLEEGQVFFPEFPSKKILPEPRDITTCAMGEEGQLLPLEPFLKPRIKPFFDFNDITIACGGDGGEGQSYPHLFDFVDDITLASAGSGGEAQMPAFLQKDLQAETQYSHTTLAIGEEGQQGGIHDAEYHIPIPYYGPKSNL